MAFAALTLLAISLATAAPPASPDTLRVLLVVDDSAARRAAVEGARLGAEEAAHTGALFGTAVVLRVREARDSGQVAGVLAGFTAADAPSIIVVAADSTACAPLARLAARREVALLDVGCPASGASAGAGAYALTAFSPADASDSTRLELWHWSLDRFGGEQLNQRFERRFGTRMTSASWAGWFAMKVSLDLALRTHATSARSLLARLRDPATQFDGQKGRPLRFAPATRRLVQPLYRVAGAGDAEHVVAEVAP